MLQRGIEKMQKQGMTKHAFVLFPILLSLLVSIPVERAHAQNVLNGNFSVPSVAQIGGGYQESPTGNGVDWTFGIVCNGAQQTSCSGVQQNGSSFHGPNAPTQQTGWIQNQGTISQKISFTKAGSYKLKFQAVAVAGILHFKVSIDGTSKDFIPPCFYTPGSTCNFAEREMSFTITANGEHTLEFAGIGQPAGGANPPQVFITQVSIAAVPPHISKGPSDISPSTLAFVLTGEAFGQSPGKIKLHFPSNSKDLTLDPGAWVANTIIYPGPLFIANPVGSEDKQTVDITVTTAEGLTSNAWHAEFHNDALITDGPTTITPSKNFTLRGWDFGEAGTLKVHFTNNSFGSSSLDSHSDVEVPVPSPSNNWKADRILAQLPSTIQGVVGQSVEISFTTKDGRKSDTWPATFVPKMALSLLVGVMGGPPTVNQCSDDGVFNYCSFAYSYHYCALGTDNILQPVATDSILGVHTGCGSIGSYNGTDVYSVFVKNSWTVDRANFFPFALDNGTVDWQPSPVPSQFFVTSVPWHIGADGGAANYYADIYIKGPIGVPVQYQ
jgi:hypothetical protein